MKKKAICLLLAVALAMMCGVQATGCAEERMDAAIEVFLTELTTRRDAFCETEKQWSFVANGSDQLLAKIFGPEQDNGLMLKGFLWVRSLALFDDSDWHMSVDACGNCAGNAIYEMYLLTQQLEDSPIRTIDAGKLETLLELNEGGAIIHPEESAYLLLEGDFGIIAIFPFWIEDRKTIYEGAHYLYAAYIDSAAGFISEWVVADQDDVHDLLKLLMAANPNIDDSDYQAMQQWCQYHERKSE